MALYQTYSYTTLNQILIDLSAFLSANGFTIDFNGVYNTSYRRLHFHKGSAHYDMYSASGLTCTMYGCTGYDSGSAPNAQPGVALSNSLTVVTGGGYCFISTTDAVYVGIISLAGLYNWGVFLYNIPNKVGSYSGGFGLSGSGASTDVYLDNWGYAGSQGAQLYINGVWTTQGNGVVNEASGNNVTTGIGKYSPFCYNSGIIPFPILIMVSGPTDSTKRIPLGYAPSIYRACPGDLYVLGDTIIIGSDTYMWMPSSGQSVLSTAATDYLFKLGN